MIKQSQTFTRLELATD